MDKIEFPLIYMADKKRASLKLFNDVLFYVCY